MIILPWWLSLVLVGGGVAMLAKAKLMDATSSFHDGTFAAEVVLAIGGSVFVIAGGLWLLYAWAVS